MLAARQRKIVKVESILEAASIEFAEKGFAGARIDEIAERSGINKAMIYYHVGDKEELHAAVVLSVLRPTLDRVREIASRPLSPPEKLRAIVGELAAHAVEHPVMPRVMMHEIAAGGAHLPDEVIRCIGGIFGSVKSVLEEGVRSGVFRGVDPLAAHFSIIASTMLYVAAAPIRVRVGRALGFPAMAERPAPETAHHLVELILHGVSREKEDLR